MKLPLLGALSLLLLALAPDARAQAPSVDELFAAAATDPAAVVPLLVAASARLAELDGQAFHELAERLEPFCKRAFFGPERLPGVEALGVSQHVVQPDELPGRIAKRYRIGPGLLAWLNAGYDERRLRAGAELKVLDLARAELHLTADLTHCRLAAWRRLPEPRSGWLLLAYLPIGIGAAETPTPVGATRITSRVKDPQWTHPVTKVVYAPGDPGNLLAGYWMALDAAGLGKEGIGLHGYTGEAPEEWLGKQRSNGCLRLLTPDMDRMFHLALEGTPVTITP
jgi:hypothetical protein